MGLFQFNQPLLNDCLLELHTADPKSSLRTAQGINDQLYQLVHLWAALLSKRVITDILLNAVGHFLSINRIHHLIRLIDG